MKSPWYVMIALALTGCIESGATEKEQDVGSTQYVELSDFSGIDQGAWFDLVGKLGTEFGQVCGDTFCEGDYANLTPLSLSCSVTSKLGSVHDCAWTFAGSLTEVDPTTSAIAVDAPTFECHVHPKTTAHKLIELWSNSADAIHEPLPGTTGSYFDELVDCFQHPIGHTPITVSTSATPTYVSASDYYTTAANQAKWAAAKAALKAGFDNICGDTYCGSDFGDLQSLDLTCSITKSSGNVKACAWVFGGSYSLPATSGALSVTSKSFNCGLPVHGTLSQLISTLTAAGTTDPIQRPLPGATTSAYDALGGCLP